MKAKAGSIADGVIGEILFMDFHKRLFISSEVENSDGIINKLKENTAVFNLYLITVSKKSNGLFEIMESGEYFKEINGNKAYTVVGIAYGKSNAFKAVEKIISRWLEGRSSLDGLKSYYLN